MSKHDKVKKIKTIEPKVRRPPNPFMLYGMQNRRLIAEANEQMKNKDVNKVLGKQWKALDEDEKNRYKLQARALKKIHQEMHPSMFNMKYSL